MRNISTMQQIMSGKREEAQARKANALIENDLLQGVSLAKECLQLNDTIKMTMMTVSRCHLLNAKNRPKTLLSLMLTTTGSTIMCLLLDVVETAEVKGQKELSSNPASTPFQLFNRSFNIYEPYL